MRPHQVTLLLMVNIDGLLVVNLQLPLAEIAKVVLGLHRRHKPGCILPQIIHSLQGNLCGLRKKGPEEDSVGEIADNLYCAY
jgi:hypothetical protein